MPARVPARPRRTTAAVAATLAAATAAGTVALSAPAVAAAPPAPHPTPSTTLLLHQVAALHATRSDLARVDAVLGLGRHPDSSDAVVAIARNATRDDVIAALYKSRAIVNHVDAALQHHRGMPAGDYDGFEAQIADARIALRRSIATLRAVTTRHELRAALPAARAARTEATDIDAMAGALVDGPEWVVTAPGRASFRASVRDLVGYARSVGVDVTAAVAGRPALLQAVRRLGAHLQPVAHELTHTPIERHHAIRVLVRALNPNREHDRFARTFRAALRPFMPVLRALARLDIVQVEAFITHDFLVQRARQDGVSAAKELATQLTTPARFLNAVTLSPSEHLWVDNVDAPTRLWVVDRGGWALLEPVGRAVELRRVHVAPFDRSGKILVQPTMPMPKP